MSRTERDCTKEQLEAVRKVMACSATGYYEILNVTQTSTEGEIKKSYRRLALVMHPDKNPAPQADEAFKRISKAFQVLSDPSKKRIFDSTGSDPEIRGAGGPGAGFAGTRGAGGPMDAGFASPEDLFNMFFGNVGPYGGGQFRGAQFGGGPFGPFGDIFGTPNARVYSFGPNGFGAQGPRAQNRARAAAAGQQNEEGTSLRQLLPVILMAVAMLFLSWLSESGSSSNSGPKFKFERADPYVDLRFTPVHRIPYFVNPKDLQDFTDAKLHRLDKTAESRFIAETNTRCSREYEQKQRMMQEAQGWIYTDEALYKRAQELPMENCKLLDTLGLIHKRDL